MTSGTLLEDGEPFAIHGNAIAVGSEVHMNTVVSGFVEAEGNVFLGNGIVTTILDRGTKDGIFRGMEQGIDRNTSTASTGYFEGTLKNGVMKGLWISANGKKSYEFRS